MGRAGVIVAGFVAATLASAALAVFFVFRTLFTDGPDDPLDAQYLFAHLLTAVAYGVAAWLLQTFLPVARWLYAAVLAVPAAVIVVGYADAASGVRALTGTVAILGAGLGAASARPARRHAGTGPDDEKQP